MQIPFLPYKIVALAPFGPASGSKPELIPVDLTTLDEAIKSVAPRFYLPMDKDLCPEGGLTLAFESMKDFKPDALVRNTAYLSRLAEARKYAAETTGASDRDLADRIRTQWPDIPIDAASLPIRSEAKSASAVDDILSMVAMPDETRAAKTVGGKGIEAQLERLLAGLLAAVYNSDEFRTYEAAWRGLEALLKKAPVKEGGRVRVEIGTVDPAGSAEVLEKLVSDLAVDLPNLVLIDVGVDAGARGIEFLTAVADFADNLLTPTAIWITSRFFHLDSWAGLNKISYLKHHTDDAAYAKWRKLSEHPGANWLSVCCNRFLTRAPYGEENKPKPVVFEERAPLWLSPVWALGALSAQSVVEHGWPSRFTDYATVAVRDLVVSGLSVGGPAVTEIVLPEDRIMEFIDIGVTPLVGPLRKDFAIMPKEITLAGGSMKFQLFFSRVLGFLFWCKEELGGIAEQGDLGQNLKAALVLYWEKTGQAAPDDVEISAGPQTDAGTVPLTISFTPPRTALPGGRKVEFGFSW